MPAELHQRLVAAALEHAPALDHEDLVRHAHGREPVRDQDDHAVAGERLELFEHLRFGARIHRRRGLVEHEDVRLLAHERT